MEVVTTASLKGGCGKTSLAVFLALALSAFKKVLCVDLDHNNNLTDYFLRDVEPQEIEANNVYQILRGTKEPDRCIYSTLSGIDVIPATPNLARIEIELPRDPGALLRFPSFLRKLDYELIIIDTPPSISFALTAALYASKRVLCPVSWSRWTIQGYSLLEEECKRASEGIGTIIDLRAIPSMVTEVEYEKLKKVNVWNMTENGVSRNIAIRNAGSGGTVLKENSKAWNEFDSLAKEIFYE